MDENLLWNTNVFEFCIAELDIILLGLYQIKLESDESNHTGINKSIKFIEKKVLELKISNNIVY